MAPRPRGELAGPGGCGLCPHVHLGRSLLFRRTAHGPGALSRPLGDMDEPIVEPGAELIVIEPLVGLHGLLPGPVPVQEHGVPHAENTRRIAQLPEPQAAVKGQPPGPEPILLRGGVVPLRLGLHQNPADVAVLLHQMGHHHGADALSPGLVPADAQIVQQHEAAFRVPPQQGIRHQFLSPVESPGLVPPGGQELFHGGEGFAFSGGKIRRQVFPVDKVQGVQIQSLTFILFQSDQTPPSLKSRPHGDPRNNSFSGPPSQSPSSRRGRWLGRWTPAPPG